MSLSEIEANLFFEKIMTDEVLFYTEAYKEDCQTFCMKRNITYLPWKKDESFCYKMLNQKFRKERITESQEVNVRDHVLDLSVLPKFRKHQVLFVYKELNIAGVVHFSDYNRDPVSIYGYALLLEFEKKLRKLLDYNGLHNEDMRDYFSQKMTAYHGDERRYYRMKLRSCQKEENQAKMKELEPFQTFFLKDLIELLEFKKIYKVPYAINDELRNTIMHSKNVVKHDDYPTSRLIYNFESFRSFLRLINLLKLENEKVSKQNPVKKETDEVKRLREAGLFKKL